MKKKTAQSKLILLLIVCLSSYTTFFPLRKEIPPIAGGLSGLTALYVGYSLLLSQNAGSPQRSHISHGLRMLVVAAGAFYAGKYAYMKCLEKTPILRFEKAQKLVNDAEKIILHSDAGFDMFLSKAFDVDLKQAFEMIQTIIAEIKEDPSYSGMYHECVCLQRDIMKMYSAHAHKEFERMKREDSFNYVSDAMACLDDKTFLEQVWKTNDISDIYAFKREMEYISVSLERVMHHFEYVIAGVSSLDDHAEDALARRASLMKGIIEGYHKRLQSRLDMISDYVRYVGIEEALQEQVTEDRLAPLLSQQAANISDSERISLIHSKYTGVDWYKKALDDLKHAKESLVQAGLDAQELLRSDSFFMFFDKAEVLYKKIVKYLEYITVYYYVMDKYALCALAQDSLHTFRKSHQLAELIPLQINNHTDATLWNWAERSYGKEWYEPLMRDVRVSYDVFIDLKRKLIRALLLPHGLSLNNQCVLLQKQVDAHLEALDIITGLLSYYEYHSPLEQGVESFLQKTLFKKLLDVDDEQLTQESVIDLSKELFHYAQMPLHVAERALGDELETLLVLQRAATNSYKACKEDERISHKAVQAFKLMRHIDSLVKRLYKIIELCRTSGLFALEGESPHDTAAQASFQGVEEKPLQKQQDKGKEPVCTSCNQKITAQQIIVVFKCCGEKHFTCKTCFGNHCTLEQGIVCPFCKTSMPQVKFMSYKQHTGSGTH